MHPGFYDWWKSRREGHRGCGGGHEAHRGFQGHGHDHGEGGRGGWRRERFEASGDFGEGNFGVRRPLRFLAHKLDLDERQVGELASILNDLKTERAQAAVDDRRAVAGFADALSGDSYDEHVS